MVVEVIIEVEDQEIKDILIAILTDLNFTGFEEGDQYLKGYISQEHLKEEELDQLLNQYGLKYSRSTIEDRNWNEMWESDFSPVIVKEFCSIRADFHEPVPNVQHEIIITPKMSFGTGHHATTYLMVEQMEQISFKNKTVADFGTGTGILSILAEKLGSTFVWAIDIDDWSIENARENFHRNGCKNVHLEKKDSFNFSEKFDIVLANINRNVILENFNGLYFGVNKGGLLLLGGLLKKDEHIILNAASRYNFLHVKTVEKDNWISILLTL